MSALAGAGLALLVGVTSLAADGAAAPTVKLVDDLGEPLGGAVEVCRTVAFAQTCDERPLVGNSLTLEPFDLLRLEAERHGPVTLRRLPADGLVALPRKARLSFVAPRPPSGWRLSIYDATGADLFRRPRGQVDLHPDRPVWLPAGSWLLSLIEQGGAPDLHPVTLEAGDEVTLRYTKRQGWSLALRVVSAASGDPVTGALAEVRASPGYGSSPPRPGRTNAAGLAAFSGLGVDLAEATVASDGFLPAHAVGLSASRGSFAARRVALERGGRFEVTVRIDGETAPGVSCTLRTAATEGREPWETVDAGETDETGRWHAGPLAAGSYSLLIEPPPDDGAAPAGGELAAAWVDNEETTRLDLDLERLRLSGVVHSGSEPVAGYHLRIGKLTTGSSTRVENVAEARTDEEGRYEATLWSPGEYQLYLQDAERRLVETDLVWVGRSGAWRDFDLDERRLSGEIVHADGRPAEGARVAVRWRRSQVSMFETDQGRFDLAFNGPGSAEITGFLDGYGSTQTETVEVGPGSPASLRLRLGEREGLSGRVTLHSRPAPGVRVTAIRVASSAAPAIVGSTLTDPGGRFVLPGDARGGVRLFLDGPGCPLTLVDLPGAQEALELACSETSAHLVVHFEDAAWRPQPVDGLVLASARRAVPREVLASHLAALGLPADARRGGEWIVPALEPGRWEIFLGAESNEATIARGEPFGYLAGLDLAPGETVEVVIAVGE